MRLLPVEEAQKRLLAMRTPMRAETLPLLKARGHWLTEDILALRNQPWADLSAMDGYAIRFDDMPGPWIVAGESVAGTRLVPTLTPGHALRIFTGAPMPGGADTVLIQEDTTTNGNSISLSGNGPDSKGRHVRPRGSDFVAGQVVLAVGTRMEAAQIALAALAGHSALPVHRKPRVALISTGSELVPVDTPAGLGMLPASNAHMLAAMLAALPCDLTDLGIVEDDFDATRAIMERASAYDVVVTIGGASVGDHDLVRPALEAAGGVIDFWKIKMRPGKPLICGTLGDALFLGLPGNPVSAFVTATLFLLPLIRHLGGSSDPLPVRRRAQLGADIPATGGRDDYQRCRIENDCVMPMVQQDSGAVMGLSQAHALLHRPAHSHAASAGETVTIIPLTERA